MTRSDVSAGGLRVEFVLESVSTLSIFWAIPFYSHEDVGHTGKHTREDLIENMKEHTLKFMKIDCKKFTIEPSGNLKTRFLAKRYCFLRFMTFANLPNLLNNQSPINVEIFGVFTTTAQVCRGQ